jgi:hydroxyethylthiazole kinase
MHEAVAPPPDAQTLRPAVAAAVDALLARRPRVHAVASPVAQPLVANVAAALGIDVSMTSDADEVVAMAERSDALLLNLGMMDAARRAGVLAAARTGVPIVLDPVKVDRSPLRLGLAHQLIAHAPAVVKGNRGEMAALAPLPREVVAVTTGAEDLVVAATGRVVLANGTPLLDRVIATGCVAGFLVAAVHAVEPDRVVASCAALSLLGTAAEAAALGAAGPGTFAAALLDALAAATGAGVAAAMRFA